MRYKFIVSYDGTNYSGFQKQINHITIQQELESAFTQVCREVVSITSSGRTDAGVSALAQVCHFDVTNELNERRVLSYVNVLLPKDIRVLNIEQTNDDFHSRKHATSKTYEYYFYIGSENPIYDSIATFVGYNINIEDMKKSCQSFVGTKDFTSFCASNSSVINKVRTITEMYITEVNDNLYKLVVSGNGFLYNMVRIIMGTLVGVGQGKISTNQVNSIIDAKDRSKAGKTMPAKGLLLKKVLY